MALKQVFQSKVQCANYQGHHTSPNLQAIALLNCVMYLDNIGDHVSCGLSSETQYPHK